MLETIITYLQQVPVIYVFAIVFIFALVENLFPPAPSDAVILFAGTLLPAVNINFILLLLFATLGSTIGFLIMFYVGLKFDKKIIEKGKLKFLKIETIEKVENWFRKWGYWLIFINRFLSGTRAVISFFAGMSLLDTKRTTIFSFLGAALWNFILIYSGMMFSKNWQFIYTKIEKYALFILFVVILISIIILIKTKFFSKKA